MIDHAADDPATGWVVYAAYPADGDPACTVEQVVGTSEFIDCDGNDIDVTDLAVMALEIEVEPFAGSRLGEQVCHVAYSPRPRPPPRKRSTLISSAMTAEAVTVEDFVEAMADVGARPRNSCCGTRKAAPPSLLFSPHAKTARPSVSQVVPHAGAAQVAAMLIPPRPGLIGIVTATHCP